MIDAVEDARGTTDELREGVPDEITRRHFAEAQKGQRDRRIEMRTGSPSPRRIDQRDRGRRHGRAHECAARERIIDGLPDGGRGMFEQGGESTRRNHEKPEPGGFDRVFGPVRGNRP